MEQKKKLDKNKRDSKENKENNEEIKEEDNNELLNRILNSKNNSGTENFTNSFNFRNTVPQESQSFKISNISNIHENNSEFSNDNLNQPNHVSNYNSHTDNNSKLSLEPSTTAEEKKK